MTLGHEVELEVFTADRPGVLGEQEGAVKVSKGTITGAPQGKSSLVAIDRSNWEAQTFLVPVDGTGHRPTYATTLELKNSTARQRGEFPTELSALELHGGYTDEQLVESFDSPLLALGSCVIIPIRLFVEPQTLTKYSPRKSYDRWPGPAKTSRQLAEEVVQEPTEMPVEEGERSGSPGPEEWPR